MVRRCLLHGKVRYFYRLTQAVIDMDATRAAEAAAAVIQHNVDPYEAIIEGLAKGMDKVNELL